MIIYRIIRVPDETVKDPDFYQIKAQIRQEDGTYTDFRHPLRKDIERPHSIYDDPIYHPTMEGLLHRDILDIYIEAEYEGEYTDAE